MLERILVVAPHADDEALGCGGLLASCPDAAKFVLCLRADDDERVAELRTSCALLGADFAFSYRSMEGLDRVDQRDLVKRIEVAIDKFRPTALFFPYPSHHHDHKLVHEACISALRPRAESFRIQYAAAYEYPYIANSDWAPFGRAVLALGADQACMKLEAVSAHASQMKGRWLDVARVKAWMEHRGNEVGVPAAEVFYPYRSWL